MCAIGLAFDWLSDNKEKSAEVRVDSQAALKIITNPYHASEMASKIRKNFQKYNGKVKSS